MAQFFSTSQRVKIGPVTGRDHLGAVAPVENVVAVSLDENILKIVDDETNDDPTVVFVESAGAIGAASVRITADALIGDGTVAISADLDFIVTSPLAEKLDIPVSDPEELPLP